MQSRVRLFGHPVHPMVVDFPIVVFPLLVGLDLLWGFTRAEGLWQVGAWLGMVGIGGSVAAFLTGTIDLAAIPDRSRAHRIAFWHFWGAMAVLAVYIFSVWSRWPLGSPPHNAALTVSLDVAGLVLVLVQGYLGSELRTRHHIGIPTVEEGAQPTELKR